MTPFSARNPIPIALISLAVIIGLLVAAYNVDRLPLIGAGTEYRALFTESAGLEVDDEVRIAGVKVGTVNGVELRDGLVVISFYAGDAYIGDRSTASIQIKSLLGDKYLAVDPLGNQPLDPDVPIPVDRTVTPYDVVQAFNGLTDTVEELDTRQLAASLRTLSETFRNTPDEVRASLDGLSRLSVTIASRDDEIARLVDNTEQVTGLLAARNTEINRILTDGAALFAELNARQAAISRLLDGTRELAVQLRGLINDNEEQIGPTLDELERLVDILQRNQDDLVAGLRRLGPFITVFTNAIGSGRWFDNFLDLPSDFPVGELPILGDLPLEPDGLEIPNPLQPGGGP